MNFDTNLCRSLLFVPAGNARYLDSALRGTADVIQIDLEDAIAPSQKDEARAKAVQDVKKIAAANRVAAVRINMEPSLRDKDLEAVVSEDLAALIIPKVDSAAVLKDLDSRLNSLEKERALTRGGIRLVAQVETAKGVLNLREIAQATPRLAAMGIGMEDLAFEIGGKVCDDALYFPNMQLLYAAREAGVVPLGYLGSITVYKDTAEFRNWIQRAAALGFEGGFCIHPNQVEILNEELFPSEEQIAKCRVVVEAFEAHKREGKGVFVHEGRMVDKPVVDQAQRVLAKAKKA